MSDDKEPIVTVPPPPPLTPEELDSLLADLAAAHAIEYPQSDYAPGSNAKPKTAPAESSSRC